MASKKLRLPALRRQLALINRSFIPEVFRKAPTDVAVYDKQRLEYELDNGTGGAYDRMVETYSRLSSPQKKPEKKKKSKSRALVKVLKRSALAEYRKEHGLDKLKKKLMDALVEYASFERGAEMVFRHITSPKNTCKIEDKKSDKGFEMMEKKENTIDGTLSTIAMYYSDITADEIALISLTNNKKTTWIYDENPFLYWPASVIGMDLDGLIVAHGTLDDKNKRFINTDNPYEIGGITGVEDKHEIFRFIPNVAQVMKALILLNLEDDDLFDKLWKQEDVTAIRRGDDLLLRSFMKPEDYGIKDNKTLNDLLRDKENTLDTNAVNTMREEIANLYSQSYFETQHINNLVDFVKLVGILERAPNFVHKRKPFKGYVKFYGTDVNFIDTKGKIVDCVPLAAHLQSSVAYQFHQRISQLNNKDKIIRGIYNELSLRVSEKNVDKENQMPIDMLHEKILERGVFVSQQSFVTVQKLSASTFLARGYADDERIVCTTKFSFDEMDDIIKLLNDMPDKFLTGVTRITKKTSPYTDVREMIAGEEKAGSYDKKTGAITLSLPIATPFSKDELFLSMRMHFARTKKEQEKADREFVELNLFKAIFNTTLAHEIGESIYANNPKIRQAWENIIDDIPADLELDERVKYFLTEYSTRAPNEDFAETFAIYWAFGSEFMALAAKHDMLAKKYQFMNKLWSHGRTKRIFPNQFPCRMYSINDRPNVDAEKRMQLGLVKESYIMDSIGGFEARIRAGTIAHSYEDVEDIIAEAEEKGEEITREEAVRRFSERAKDEAVEKIEELRQTNWVYAEIRKRTYSALISPDFEYVRFDQDFDDFARAMIDGKKKKATGFLEKAGVPKTTANKVVKKMMPFYKGAADIIEEKMIKKEEIMREGFMDHLLAICEYSLKTRFK